MAAGLSITGLAVGTALAGAVASLGLALAVCLLNPRHTVTVDRSEFFRKCLLLLAACGVLALFVRDGTLSYTGTGLLMFLFVVFVLISIVYQHHYIYGGAQHHRDHRRGRLPPPSRKAPLPSTATPPTPWPSLS